MKQIFLRKSVIASLALFACITTANADVVIVEQAKDGLPTATQKSSYDLGDKPVITFDGSNLVVKTDQASAEFPLATVVKYYFAESDPTGTNTETEQMALVFATEDGVQLLNCQPDMTVALFSVSGQLIKEYRTSNEGSLEINLSSQSKGIYLIKLNNTTIKVIR